MFNKDKIESLERHIALARERAQGIAGKAAQAGRVMNAREHGDVETALAEATKFTIRLQYEKALAGTFGQRY